MTDILVILALILIVGGAAAYVYKAKKRGQKCIGCPHAAACAEKAGCTCKKN